MTTLQKIYEDIFNKSRFLAQDNYYTPIDTDNKCWQKLAKLDDTINQLPASVQQYIAYLCSFYKTSSRREHMTYTENIENEFYHLSTMLKKICEVYAIGLLVCDNLLTQINILNVNKKAAKVTIPTISYNNACHYLSWIGRTLQRNLAKMDSDNSYAAFQLAAEDIATLNCYSKLLTNIYNSSALGIFRKQPVRRFNTEEVVITA